MMHSTRINVLIHPYSPRRIPSSVVVKGVPHLLKLIGNIKTFTCLPIYYNHYNLSYSSVRRSFKTASSAVLDVHQSSHHSKLLTTSATCSSSTTSTTSATSATATATTTASAAAAKAASRIIAASFSSKSSLSKIYDEYTGTPEELEELIADQDRLMLALRANLGETGLPLLPNINNEDIRRQIFTHRSVHSRQRNVFEEPEGDPAPDNEVLEHQGDSVLNFIVTDLILSRYPNLRVGPATKMRSLVVGNATLADISVQYGLPKFVRFHPAQALSLRTSMHIQADVFEAYVGGLYKDQGLEVTREWLKALFTPYVKEAYRICLENHIPGPISPPSPPPSPKLPGSGDSSNPAPSGSTNLVGHLALFNQYAQQKRLQVEWVFEPIKQESSKMILLWTVHANVNGKLIASGRGNTKKAAQNEAARECLVQLGTSFSVD